MNINDIKAALSVKASAITIPVPVTQQEKSSVTVPIESKPVAEQTIKNEFATNTVVVAEKPKAMRKPRTKKATAQVSEPTNNTTVSMVVEPKSIDDVVAKILKPHVDYGIIPGCRKPSLLKAGAEKLAAYYAYSTSIEVLNRYENYEKGLVAYEIKTTVRSATGTVIAEGIGAANSRERKFLRGDFFSQINTVLKMAKKRAYVDGILTATGSSSLFTQDMEDIAAGNDGQRMEEIG